MNIQFHNNPPAPAVTSLGGIPYTAAVPWPGKAVSPNLPSLNFTTGVPSKVGLTIADIALRAALDIRPNFISPVLTASLLGLFKSALFSHGAGTASLLTIKGSYRHMPSNWKRIFSETIAAGVALTLAERVADYPYFVPLEFCKSGSYLGAGAWPAAIAALVPRQYAVKSRWDGLMPDYVLARYDGANWEFSTVESKGRDSAVHTGKYGDYPKFKIQSMNAQLVPAPSFIGPAPKLKANFLGITAIRGTSVRPATRAVQARWFNHRHQDIDTSVPKSWGVEFAAAHYSALLHRLGFVRLGNALGAAKLHLEGQRDFREDVAAMLDSGRIAGHFGLYKVDDSVYGRESAVGEFYRPILTDGTLEVISMLANALRKRDEELYGEVSQRLFENNQKARELSINEDFRVRVGQRTLQTGRLSLSSSGIGLVTEDLERLDSNY